MNGHLPGSKWGMVVSKRDSICKVERETVLKDTFREMQWFCV